MLARCLPHIVPHVLLGKREVRHPFSHRPSCFAGQARGTSSFLTSSLMFCWASERYVILSHIVPHVLLGKREVRHPFSHRPSCFAGQARGTSSFLTSSLMFCWASERYVILSHIVPHVLLGKREVRHPFSHRPSCFAGQARGTSSFLTSSLMFCWASERYVILSHIVPHVLLGKREVRHPFSHRPSCFAGQARGTSSFLTSSLMFCWASERYVILSHIVPHVLLGKREVRHPFSHRPSCFAGQARGTSSFLTSSLMFCWASERYVILSHIVPHVLLGKREVCHPFSHRPSCFAGQARGTSSFLTSSLMFCWASEMYVILSHIVPHVLLGKREVRHPFSHGPSCFAGQARGTSSFLTSSLMFCWASERYVILSHIVPHVLLGKREVRHPFLHCPSCFAGQTRGTSSFLISCSPEASR